MANIGVQQDRIAQSLLRVATRMSTKLQLCGKILFFMLAVAVASLGSQRASAQSHLLNVSYDPTRELYATINPLFSADWKKRTGQDISIRMSHGGSGAQARRRCSGTTARPISRLTRLT